MAEDEAAVLRVKLASLDECAKMLQTRQEDLRKEHGAQKPEAVTHTYQHVRFGIPEDGASASRCTA